MDAHGLDPYNLGAYTLIAYTQSLPDFGLLQHSLDWWPTVLRVTVLGVSSGRRQSWAASFEAVRELSLGWGLQS